MALPFLKIKHAKAFNLTESPQKHLLSLIDKAKASTQQQAMQTPQLYDKNTIDQCPWPQTEEGMYAKNLLVPLIKKGVTHYISNIETDLRVLVWNDLVLPITINQKEYHNSYVCSPYSYYISYAKKSLKHIAQNWAHPVLHSFLTGLSSLFYRFQVNQVVTVNNWLLSTNLYPSLQANQLEAIAIFLKKQFPTHAIVFRSIDALTSPLCCQTLKQLGYHFIASREIFSTDAKNEAIFESRLFKSDLRLLKNSGYEVIDHTELTQEDLPRILELYQKLYINKHSNLNPQLTLPYLKLMFEKNLFHFFALKKEGKIDGVVGVVKRNQMMLCPFLGYDLNVPKESCLYRLLCTILMLEAKKNQLLFHQSSGASMYKKIRKAVPCIEYIAIDYKHLSFKRKIPWQLLKLACNSVGIYYMRRY